ncbi:MAG TPA: hypothetical protein VGM03_04355, partial [Phycisphaerae bacterium]
MQAVGGSHCHGIFMGLPAGPDRLGHPAWILATACALALAGRALGQLTPRFDGEYSGTAITSVNGESRETPLDVFVIRAAGTYDISMDVFSLGVFFACLHADEQGGFRCETCSLSFNDASFEGEFQDSCRSNPPFPVQGSFSGDTLTMTISPPAGQDGILHFTGTRPPHGACCCLLGSGCEFTCEFYDVQECADQGGSFQGSGTQCEEVNCFPTGACCLNNSCSNQTEEMCLNFGGAYQGNNTSCAGSGICSLPGACCTCDGSCTLLTQGACGLSGGAFQGEGTNCNSSSTCALGTQWKDAVSGTFEMANRWANGSIPDPVEATVFDQSGSYIVHFDSPHTNDRTAIRNGNVTFENASYDLTVQNASPPSLAIGSAGTLTLNQCPLLSSRDATVGYCGATLCTLNLIESNLVSSGVFSIGKAAPGKVSISGNSLLTSFQSRVGESRAGEAILNGSPAQWSAGNLTVGFEASGTLTIQNGGKVSADSLFVGLHAAPGNATTDGTVVIKGVGNGELSSLDVTHDLDVGKGAHGSLELLDGGQAVASGDVIVGDEPQASGSITVSGVPAPPFLPSKLGGGRVFVGLGGAGQLSVQHGAQLSSGGDLIIGDALGSMGTVEVKDGATKLDSATITVGNRGHGVLNIVDGAEGRCFSTQIGKAAGGTGVVVIMNGPASGPAWRLLGDAEIGAGGAGSLSVDNAIVQIDGTLSIGNAGAGSVLLKNAGAHQIVGLQTIIRAMGVLAGIGFHTCPTTTVQSGGMLSTTVQVAG